MSDLKKTKETLAETSAKLQASTEELEIRVEKILEEYTVAPSIQLLIRELIEMVKILGKA